MKHARKDYNRIQDPGYTDDKGVFHKIPDDEPVFLIRAQDLCSSFVLLSYAKKAEDLGAKDNIIDSVLRQADRMIEWQSTHKCKCPDMPSGSEQ